MCWLTATGAPLPLRGASSPVLTTRWQPEAVSGPLARDVEDRVHVPRLEISEQATGIAGRERIDRDPASLRFLAYLRGDGERAIGARSDDEPRATRGNVLGTRQRRVPELVAQRLRGALPPPADPSALDHHVASVRLALDLELSERDQLRLHECMS